MHSCAGLSSSNSACLVRLGTFPPPVSGEDFSLRARPVFVSKAFPPPTLFKQFIGTTPDLAFYFIRKLACLKLSGAGCGAAIARRNSAGLFHQSLLFFGGRFFPWASGAFLCHITFLTPDLRAYLGWRFPLRKL